MTRKEINVESQRDHDLKQLTIIADRLDDLNTQSKELFDQRRVIWKRRLDSGDTTKATLARASRCHSMNVTQGIKESLMEKVKS